jgi:prepilin-type N-terminal cleavage/methylation domain-containing protein
MLLTKAFLKNRQGFTLIEIMAVLVIMGVMASVAVNKINDISGTADERALETGIAELNAREMLYWTNAKFATGGWTADTDVTNDPGYNINLNRTGGTDYTWTAGPDASGGTLRFGSRLIVLTRTVSTNIAAARWGP